MDYDSDCVSYCLYCQLKIPSDIHYCSTLCQWRDLCLPNVPEIMTSQIVYAGGYMEKSNVSFNDSDEINDSNSCLASSVSSNESIRESLGELKFARRKSRSFKFKN